MGTEAQVRVTWGVRGDPCMAPLGVCTPSWGCGPGGQLPFLASGDSALIPASGQQEGSLVGAGRCPGEAPHYAPPVPCPKPPLHALLGLSPEPTPLGVSSVAAGFRFFHIFHLRALPAPPQVDAFKRAGLHVGGASLPRSLFSFRWSWNLQLLRKPGGRSRPR